MRQRVELPLLMPARKYKTPSAVVKPNNNCTPEPPSPDTLEGMCRCAKGKQIWH